MQKKLVGFVGLGSIVFCIAFGHAQLAVILIWLLLIGIIILFFGFSKTFIWRQFQLMTLTPLLFVNYLSANDFNFRLLIFLLLTLGYSLFFEPMSDRGYLLKKLDSVKKNTLLSFLAFALVGFIFWQQGVWLSGDEPHYLLIASSLLQDGDCNLQNNLQNEDYKIFHPVRLELHGYRKDNGWYPFHLPGLSVLYLLPLFFYKFLFSFIPAQLFFRIVAGFYSLFFCWQLLRLLEDLFPQFKTSTGLLFILTFPLLFHGIHIYPELPAAALLILSWRKVFLTERSLFLSGVLLGFIFWLHLKYLPVIVAFNLIFIYQKIGDRKFREVMLLAIPQLVSFAFLTFYSWSLYGSFNPATIFPSGSLFAVSWRLRIETFLAYFFDQRDGLLFYAPFVLLFFSGLRARFKFKINLLILLLSYWFAHSLTTVRGGYSPAGRSLLFVFFIIVVFIVAAILQKEKNSIKVKVLFLLSFFQVVMLVKFPLALYQPVVAQSIERASALAVNLSSDQLYLPDLFPSFLKSNTNYHHLANYCWILIALGFFFLPSRIVSKKFLFSKVLLGAGFTFFAFWLTFFPLIRFSGWKLVKSQRFCFLYNSADLSFNQEKGYVRLKAGKSYLLLVQPSSLSDRQRWKFYLKNPGSVKLLNGQREILRLSGQQGEFYWEMNNSFNRVIRGEKFVPLEIIVSQSAEFLFIEVN